jgi:DNA-binding MarR family transcriptional regulator
MDAIPPSIPPPTIEVIVASIANGRRLNARIDRDLKDLGLTWGRFHMLVVLGRTDGWIHASSLARKMGITRQSAHALLHHLDERGFLRWMHDPWVHSARLTTDGARILAHAHEALGDTFAAIGRVEVAQRKAIVAAEYAIKRELNRPVHRPAWYAGHLPQNDSQPV